MKNPQGVEVDASANHLFVSDTNNHRVTVFDVASITDGEKQPDGWRYHVPDALGSVRQLVDPAGTATGGASRALSTA